MYRFFGSEQEFLSDFLGLEDQTKASGIVILNLDEIKVRECLGNVFRSGIEMAFDDVQ